MDACRCRFDSSPVALDAGGLLARLAREPKDSIKGLGQCRYVVDLVRHLSNFGGVSWGGDGAFRLFCD